MSPHDLYTDTENVPGIWMRSFIRCLNKIIGGLYPIIFGLSRKKGGGKKGTTADIIYEKFHRHCGGK